MKKRLNKEINNEYVKIFQEKIDKDNARETDIKNQLKERQK